MNDQAASANCPFKHSFEILRLNRPARSLCGVRLPRNSLCLNLAAGRANENPHLGKHAKAWNGADVLHYLAASRANDEGLRQAVSSNLSVEYRWAAEGDRRWDALVTDLVNRRVSVIVAPGVAAALAAKAATRTISIVFTSAIDPVEAGLVASLNRPGGNLTGMSGLISAVAAKRLQLLHELAPAATTIAFLVTRDNGGLSGPETKELQAAARTLGIRLLVVNADRPSEFEAAFATLVSGRAGGLVLSGGKSFTGHADQLVPLAARFGVPAIYGRREGATAGGLMSYGIDFPEMYRQVGVYTGRILKGEKPADLPVQQATRVELVINLFQQFSSSIVGAMGYGQIGEAIGKT
jgi:putative ABC transport system substrate-binding protein